MSENTEIVPSGDAGPKLPQLNTLGARLAKEPIEKLQEAVGIARAALEGLREDSSVSTDVRKSVVDLIEQTSTDRPDLGEMNMSWAPPRVMIAQPTTREEKRPEGAKNGSLFTSEGKLLEMPWPFIPIYFFEEHVNFGDNGKMPVCRSIDGHLGSPFGSCNACPNLPFGKQNGGRGDQRQTDCYSQIVVISLAADMSQVYTTQFGKTSRKAGSALLSWVRSQRRAWKQSYLLDTEKKSGNNNLYWIYSCKATGRDNPEDVQKVAKSLHDLYHAERSLQLADWYMRPAQAAARAQIAEQGYDGSAFEAGMLQDGVEPDMTAPAPTPITSGKSGTSSRHSNKPM